MSLTHGVTVSSVSPSFALALMGPNSTFAIEHIRDAASQPLTINPTTLILTLIIFLVACAPNRYLGTRYRPDLPGPRGWPLIGNTIDVFFNRKRMLMRLHELGSRYGELFSLTLPIWGRSIVINHPAWLEHVRKGGLH
jgi:hypothetical protein